MNREFRVHKLNEIGLAKAQVLAEKFDELLTYLTQTDMLPEGRELSIVKTKLEEACFFAKKAMAQNPVNQES